MPTIVDASTGQALGVVHGRNSGGAWLAARLQVWLAQVEVVAVNPFAEVRKALCTQPAHAAFSVGPFRLVQIRQRYPRCGPPARVA